LDSNRDDPLYRILLLPVHDSAKDLVKKGIRRLTKKSLQQLLLLMSDYENQATTIIYEANLAEGVRAEWKKSELA
jgi:hypothetical protein